MDERLITADGEGFMPLIDEEEPEFLDRADRTKETGQAFISDFKDLDRKKYFEGGVESIILFHPSSKKNVFDHVEDQWSFRPEHIPILQYPHGVWIKQKNDNQELQRGRIALGHLGRTTLDFLYKSTEIPIAGVIESIFFDGECDTVFAHELTHCARGVISNQDTHIYPKSEFEHRRNILEETIGYYTSRERMRKQKAIGDLMKQGYLGLSMTDSRVTIRADSPYINTQEIISGAVTPYPLMKKKVLGAALATIGGSALAGQAKLAIGLTLVLGLALYKSRQRKRRFMTVCDDFFNIQDYLMTSLPEKNARAILGRLALREVDEISQCMDRGMNIKQYAHGKSKLGHLKWQIIQEKYID